MINRAVMWYPLDAAVVEPGVRALQEMCDLGPLVRPIALKATQQKTGWVVGWFRRQLEKIFDFCLGVNWMDGMRSGWNEWDFE